MNISTGQTGETTEGQRVVSAPMNDPFFDNVYVVTFEGEVEDVCARLEVAKLFADGTITASNDLPYSQLTWNELIDLEEDQKSWIPAEDAGDGWVITEWSVRDMLI